MDDAHPRRRAIATLEDYIGQGGEIVRYYYASELPEGEAPERYELGYSVIGVLLKELGYTDRALISLSGNSITNDLVEQVRRMRARLQEAFGITPEELRELERVNDASIGYQPVVEDPDALLEEVRRVLEHPEGRASDSDPVEVRSA